LNEVSAHAAESVHDVCVALSEYFYNPVRNMFCDCLWGYGVPTLLVNLHAPVELAEKVVAMFVELVQVFALGLLDLLVLEIIAL